MSATVSDAASSDIELDKMLVTTMISIILYGRQAFPENCFRELSADEVQHPTATHKHLLESGQRLSERDDPVQLFSPERDTAVYLRECNNPRLHSLLRNLDQIFTALADRLLGKVYVCFNDAKEWSRDSLLECFTLQFSYAEHGGLCVYAHWAGKGDAPLKGPYSGQAFDSDSFFDDLKQVVLTCPQLPDRFYTRLFVSAVNKQTELQGVWAGNGHGVREALLGLKYKEGTSRLRIGSFLCEARTREPDREGDSDQEAGQDLPEIWPGTLNTLSPGSSDLNLSASPTRPPSLVNPKKGPRLAMIEEVPEDLPPTQRLQTPVRSQSGPKSAFANPSCLSTDSEGSPSPMAERKASENLWSTQEPPQGSYQAGTQSQPSQKGNTARTYGGRSKPAAKRARTMA